MGVASTAYAIFHGVSRSSWQEGLVAGIATAAILGLGIFLFHLIRAPGRMVAERDAEIASLKKQLGAKQAAATSADWAALRVEFEKHSSYAAAPHLDWIDEENIQAAWSYRGFGLRSEFEALARRGLKLAIQSTYCQSRTTPDLTVCLDAPIQGWAEMIRRFVPSAYHSSPLNAIVNDVPRLYDMGSINDAFKASALLCMELESREDA